MTTTAAPRNHPVPSFTAGGRCAAIVLAVALLLSGCFAGGSGGAEDDRLGVGLAFAPAAEMSPYSDDALLLSRLGVTETLLDLDRSGDPRPALAQRWQRVDPTTVRLTLRHGVTFHDGTPLTGERAASALNHAARATPVPRALRGIRLTARPTGPHALEVSTARPDPVLPRRLTAPQTAILSPAAYAGSGDSPDPTGTATGPYVLKSLQGTTSATLDANRHYRGGPPKASGIDARFIPDGAGRVAALRAGEVDVVGAVPVSQLPTITEQRVIDLPLPRLVSAHLNTARGPLADPALRAAVRETIDPATIADGVYAGQADPARGLFGPASPWAKPAAAARQPVAPGDPGGRAIRIATYNERPELPRIASVIAERLRSAGFRVPEVVVREYSTIESELLGGSFDVVIGARSYAMDTGDPISYLRTDWTCDGHYNLAQLCEPSIDAAVAEASTLSGQRRTRAALRIARDILATGAVVPLVHERTRIGVAPGVTGVARDSFERKLITAETTIGA